MQLEMTLGGDLVLMKGTDAKSNFIPSLERIRPVQFFTFMFKALFGSILRATENKLI